MKMGDLVRVRSWSCLIWTLNLNLLHKEGVGVRGGGQQSSVLESEHCLPARREEREKRDDSSSLMVLN